MSWEGNEGDEHIRFYKVSVDGVEKQRDFFFQGEPAHVEIDYEIMIPAPELTLGVAVWNQRNQLLGSSRTPYICQQMTETSTKRRKALFKIDTALFHEGDYSLKLECQLHNKKRILGDQIALKLQIYQPTHASELIHSYTKDGIFLGNHWEL
jgi:lipopolysaccharide transport system ATP-binding protein